ncbi:MAG: hypothetical protein WKF68_10885 [Daejeonella sp.]
MKRLLILFAISVGLGACTTTPENNTGGSSDSLTENAADDDPSEPSMQTLCFQKLGGTSNQDTTSLSLTINGEEVSGDFAHYPYQKDSRVGTISAVKKNDLIKGIWIYMQEGMNDTLAVEFRLSGDKLVQKNYTVDPKTGREVFSDGSVFNIEFRKVNCSN